MSASGLILPGSKEWPADYATDVFMTIDAAGNVTFDFTGVIIATGLTLPEGTLQTPPDTNRVRWVDDPNTVGSPERAYLFGTTFRGVEATDYLLQMAVQDGLGGDIINLVLREIGSGRLPPNPTAEIYAVPFGATAQQRILYLAPSSTATFTRAPIVELLPLQGNAQANPATAIGSGNDYGIIELSQFPPTGANAPQHGGRVTVVVDGTDTTWNFVYSTVHGGWLCTGGTPIFLDSSSPTTLTPASTWVAMGFAHTLARGGTYLLSGTVSGAGSTAGASTQQLGFSRAGALLPFPQIEFSTPSPSFAWNASSVEFPVSITAGQAVDLMAWGNGTNATVTQKLMTIMPVIIN